MSGRDDGRNVNGGGGDVSVSNEGQFAGFYGKLPALGDFVGRRLGRDFVTPWDDWLQLSMAASRNQLGDAWLDTYLTSPLWRFVLSAGVCGDEARAGVLMPSVDRVGRYFPLALVASLPAGVSLPAVAGDGGEWFVCAEALLLSTLDDEVDFEIDAFDALVGELGVPAGSDAGIEASDVGGALLRMPLTDADDLTSQWQGLAALLARRELGDYSLWWTAGSEQVEPSLLLCEGLPAPDAYAAMLDGVWSVESAAAPPPVAPVEPAAPSDGAPMILDAGYPEDPV